MNAICERLFGTLRRELLDRMLISASAPLRSVLTEYQAQLQHGQAASGHRPSASPTAKYDGGHPACRPRPRTDPPQTRPQRPDQRIHAA